MAERKDCNRATNDGLRGESATADTGKEHWTGTGATMEFLAAERSEMKLLDNPDIVRIQNWR